MPRELEDTRSVTLISDLDACYRDLLAGTPVEKLAKKYVKIEVLAAQELYAKGATLEELRRFHERQAARLEVAKTHRPLVCSCGLMLFDMVEYRQHVVLHPPSDSILQEPEEHKLRRGRL